MFNKKFFILTIFLIVLLSISVVSAEDSADSVVLDDTGGDIELNEINTDSESDDSDIQEVLLDKNIDDVSEDNLQSLDNDDQIMDDDYSKNKNVLTSSSSSEDSNDNRIIDTSSTEVLLVEDAPEGYCYIVDSITKYPNSKVKLKILAMPYMKGTGYGGTVTVTFNGKSFTAKVYEGEATIVATTPSKVGSYKAKLTFNGYDYVFNDGDIYRYNSSTSYFTLKVKKCPTIVTAAKVTAKHKQSKYFTVRVKDKVSKKFLKNTQIILKVYTGKKYRTYKVKTNSKGIAKLNTKRFSVGTHKVLISSGNKNYNIKKTSKIIIKKSSTTSKKKSSTTSKKKSSTTSKKKSSVRSVTMPTKFDKYCTKYVGAYKIQTYKFKATLYQEVDVFLYKNGKMVNRNKFKSKVYYKRYGKNRSTKWSHGYENSVYHKYQTGKDTKISKVLVRF